MTKRIVIMAGGTGGHIFPALAVAEELRAQSWDIQWLGSRGGMETKIVSESHIPCHQISIRGVRGKGLLGYLLAPLRIFYALVQALMFLRRMRPAVVLGMGGFVSGPGGLAAKLLRIPLVIHEQNAVPGTTNRWLAKISDRVLSAFPVNGLGRRVEVLGNPIRRAIAKLPDPLSRGVGSGQPLRLLVLGGSLGAVAINELVPRALAQLAPVNRPRVVHQSGSRNLEQCIAHYADCQVEAQVVPFIEQMDAAYSAADLVIARAGALTVSEIAAAGLPSILIPYPYAIDDHQTLNAQRLVDHGAALMFQQNDLSSARLAAVIEQIQKDNRIQSMAQAARSIAAPDAAQDVAKICMQLVGENS